MNQRIASILSALLLLGAARLPAATPAAPAPADPAKAPAAALAEAPAVLGILEIRGLDNLAAAAFELSKAAGSPVSKDMLSMMLYGALGTMSGLGIPGEGTLRAVAFDNGSDQGGLALLLPVDNGGADYLAGLGQNGWRNETETADDILHFIAPPDSGLAWSDVYFLKRGATLLAARSAADARLADAARAALPPILPVEGDVALQILPAALADAFGPQIAEKMDQAFNNPDLPGHSAALGRLYFKSYLAVARQLEAGVLGLGVADGNLNVHTRLAAVPGTALDAWLRTLRAPAPATAVVALPDALAVETLNLGDLALLAPAYFRFIEETMRLTPTGLDPVDLQRYLDNEKAAFAQLAGDVGLALLPPSKEQPLRFAEFVGLKDSAVLRAMLAERVQTENAMFQAMVAAETNSPMPFDMRAALGAPRQYRGIDVDHLSYSIVPGPVLAAIWPPAIPNRLDLELAWLPGGVLVVAGDSALADSLVDRALDGAAAPLADLPAWKSAYPMPERNLVDLSHVALFDLVRAYLALGDSITGGTNAQWVPASPGNLEASAYVLDGLMSRIRFRLADVEAVALKIKEAQQKAMDDMMRQMQAPAPAQPEETAAEPAPAADDQPVPVAPDQIPAPAPAE